MYKKYSIAIACYSSIYVLYHKSATRHCDEIIIYELNEPPLRIRKKAYTKNMF